MGEADYVVGLCDNDDECEEEVLLEFAALILYALCSSWYDGYRQRRGEGLGLRWTYRKRA